MMTTCGQQQELDYGLLALVFSTNQSSPSSQSDSYLIVQQYTNSPRRGTTETEMTAPVVVVNEVKVQDALVGPIILNAQIPET
jgi:hypothetical protein